MKADPKVFRRWAEVHAQGLHTKTQWKDLGRVLLPKADPAASFAGRYATYPLYDKAATRAKKKPSGRPPVEIDLLDAIFSVTRAAKRFRNAASKSYESGAFGLANIHRERKEECYELKDRGIVAAFRAGRIAPVAVAGNLTVYRGEGYCFHSMLRPRRWKLPAGTPDGEPVTVEAKPRGAKEPRLKDALATLARLPAGTRGFLKVPFPSKDRSAQTISADRDDDWWEEDENDDDNC